MTDEWRETNRAWWDERVPAHADSAFYDLDGFREGADHLRDFELAEVGSVDGLDLLHLQCHLGTDTLGWARRGARVTGLDFSGPAVVTARALAEATGLDADFVQADVYDASEALGGRDFDIVYTGLGAIGWLPDLRRWAELVAGLVRPSGLLYLAEFHPFTEVFGDDDLTVESDYFRGPQVWDDAVGTYTDPGARSQSRTVHNRVFDFAHPLGTVVSAVIDAGFTVELLHEHDYTLFARWPSLEPHDDGTYRFAEGSPRIPLMYSLRARAAERAAERGR